MDQTLIYHFSAADGAYVGSSVAEMSPRQPDVPLVPAFATLLAPPAAGPGQAAVFVDGAWVLGAVLSDDAAPIVLQALTPQEQLVVFSKAVQSMLDATARSMGYDNIFTAVTYADEPAVVKFQNEGRSLRAWRSLTWQACNEVLAAVASGDRPAPTINELIGELPAFELLTQEEQAG